MSGGTGPLGPAGPPGLPVSAVLSHLIVFFLDSVTQMLLSTV